MLQKIRPDIVQEEIFFERQSAWRRSTPAKLLSLCRSLASPLPAKVRHFRSRRFARRLRQCLTEGNFVGVVITGVDMLWCADLLPPAAGCRIYLANNVGHELYAPRPRDCAGCRGSAGSWRTISPRSGAPCR